MIAFAMPVAAIAQQRTVEFNLPSQDLGSALRAVARISGEQVIFRGSAVRGRRSTALSGRHSADEAVRIVLQGTALQVGRSPRGILVVTQPPAAPVASEAPPRVPPPGEARAAGAAADNESAEQQEIVVTGSNIRGAPAAGSRVDVIDREQIEMSGASTVQDVFRDVPQNFSGFNGARNSVAAGLSNNTRGTEIELRGLGVGSTLTLVDGQRQAGSGSFGAITDISTIPLAAIERVEILTDGASALYGSDAIAGVVNIRLRDHFNGLEVRGRVSTADGDNTERNIGVVWGHDWSNVSLILGYQYYASDGLLQSQRALTASNGDLRPFGGSNFRTVGGNPGTVISPIPGAIPSGQDGTNVTAATLLPGTNFNDDARYAGILPDTDMHSVFARAVWDLLPNLEWSANGRFSARDMRYPFPQSISTWTVPANNPFNRFGAAARLTYDFTPLVGPAINEADSDTLFLSTSLRLRLSPWQISVRGAYSKTHDEFNQSNLLNTTLVNQALQRTDAATALNIFGDTAFSRPNLVSDLADLASFAINDVRILSGNILADGPLFDLPGGQVRMAVGAEYRDEDIVSTSKTSTATIPVVSLAGRQIGAVFGELAIPLLAPDSAVGRVDLSAAARYEDYSDAGTTLNPKFGINWTPIRGARLRGTWGTSFRAPPFYNANPAQRRGVVAANFVDPGSPTGRSTILALSGPVPDLRPETADVWTFGFDLTPVPDLAISVTYYNINYQNRIQNPGAVAGILSQPAIFGDFVIRNPTQAQLAAICATVLVTGDCTTPTVIVDNRVRNLAISRTQGIDFDLRYGFASGMGRWDFRLNGTYVLHLEQQVIPTLPIVDIIDTVGNPLRFRMSARAGLSQPAWTLLATLNYTGAYEDPAFVPKRPVAAYASVDGAFEYRFSRGFLAHTQVNLNVRNLLDRRPPFINQFAGLPGSGYGYDVANADLLGRVISLQLVHRW